MPDIHVLVPEVPQLWQQLIAERLERLGHSVTTRAAGTPSQPLGAVLIPRLEAALLRRGSLGLAAAAPSPAANGNGRSPTANVNGRSPTLTVDLRGTGPNERSASSLRLLFNNGLTPASGLAALVSGKPAELAVVRNGTEVIARAFPMRDDPAIVVGGYEAMLARAVTLMVATADRVLRRSPGIAAEAEAPPAAPPPRLISGYIFSALPRLASEILRRRRYRYAHWRVGYRFSDGPYVSDTLTLGKGWSVLADDGSRFFADPFPFSIADRRFIFIEDYPHATRKAVISVVEIEGGSASSPRPVLEEPHHLSYPQVFSRDGETWMLPEGSGGGSLTLYRALDFPDRWEKHAVLISGREISDATLLEHAGRLWLFATDRDGHGSTSDTLVVYSAERLGGPWTPHPMNPILIDRAAARPGGAVVTAGGRLLLPVQDGTECYGGGLGFAEITRLDDAEVAMSRPHPIAGPSDWPYPRIHTYNRDGRLEVIDGLAAVRK
jgi:hypothetical protein